MPNRSTIAPHPVPPGLAKLTERFRVWRATRQRGERNPAELWQAATDQARIHEQSETVAALKLSYYELQYRLRRDRASRRGRLDAPVFVEVPSVSLPPGGGERGTVGRLYRKQILVR